MSDARNMRKDGRRYWASLLKKGRGDCGLVLSSHGRKGGGCKWMNGAAKEKSCRGEGGFLPSLIFAKKMFKGQGL